MGVNHGPNPQPEVERSVPTTETDNTAANAFYFPQTFLKIFLESFLPFINTEGREDFLIWFLLNSHDNTRKLTF